MILPSLLLIIKNRSSLSSKWGRLHQEALDSKGELNPAYISISLLLCSGPLRTCASDFVVQIQAEKGGREATKRGIGSMCTINYQIHLLCCFSTSATALPTPVGDWKFIGRFGALLLCSGPSISSHFVIAELATTAAKSREPYPNLQQDQAVGRFVTVINPY